MKKIVLFDFDGVIVDSFEISYQLGLADNPTWTKEQQKNLFDGNLYEEIGKLKESGFVGNDEEFFKKFTPLLMELPPVEGMAHTINELAKNYQLVVVSSTISSPIQGYLDMHKLDRHFDWIMGGDVHKSKVEKIRMILREYNVQPEDCIFITDTLGDMREAAKCNVQAIGVTWGFHERERLEKESFYKLIDAVEELVPAVHSFFKKNL